MAPHKALVPAVLIIALLLIFGLSQLAMSGSAETASSSSQQSAVSSQQSAINNQQPTVNSQQSTTSNQQPVTSNQQLATSDHVLPLMIRWFNWRPEFGHAYVYAREQDLQGMLDMQDDVTKMLMLTSYGETERLMQRADELHAAGVRYMGINTENGLTPPNEMQTLLNPDPDENIVARVARLGTEHGFIVVWGPVRLVADQASDEVLRTMMRAGITGVALQEQKFIEVSPANERANAVERTIDRYQRLAQAEGIINFEIHVQIMHQRCPDLANCVDFVAHLEEIPAVTGLGIWSNGAIPLDFVQAIRQE